MALGRLLFTLLLLLRLLFTRMLAMLPLLLEFRSMARLSAEEDMLVSSSEESILSRMRPPVTDGHCWKGAGSECLCATLDATG